MRSKALPYTIVSCSSQDPTYPIDSIQNASIRSSGWQSANNPVYPVSFIIDFGSKVDLETLQFVSHQSKIPAKVDLYFGDQPPKFKHLGSFQFSDNSHTRFSARELKSANLQRVSARFIRVSIANCHKNPNNPNNQVGIVSFKAIGKENPNSPRNPTFQQPQSSRPTTQAYESEINNQLRNLEIQKQQAVATEDFQAAARFKKEIDSLKSKRDSLVQLQRAKQKAIENENFEEASAYKEQIERLINGETDNYTNSPPNYQSTQPTSPKPQRRTSNQPQSSPISQPTSQPQSQRKAKTRPTQPPPEPEQELDSSLNYTNQSFSKQKSNSQLQEKTRDIIATDYDPYADPPIRKTNGADLSEDRPINPAKNLPNDDYEENPENDDNVVDPRPSEYNEDDMFHGFKIDNLAGTIPAFKEDESPTCDDPPDELTPGDKQEAQPLINQFGEDPVKRFFSKPWALRLQGIHMLQDLISGLAADYVPLFINFCYILRHRIQELQKQVVLASLNAVQMIADTHQIEPPELTRGVSQFLNHAVAKIGGSQKAVTDGVCQFLIWLSKKRALDVVLPIVMKPVKNAAQWKAQLAKINTLHELLFMHGIDSTPGLSTQEVMNCVLPALESPKKEVRDAVIEMMVTIEQCIGTAIYKYIDGLPPRTKKEVKKAIEEHQQQADEDYQ
ncbi:hypothetical protein M9Y10_033976 [Tritrichomonas musculus]|uniref:UVR domain-containing protein n=1 Tax=Tritrichomonas musculus TaxID=1915356 RepID=A0ABR2KDL7_9EUKA